MIDEYVQNNKIVFQRRPNYAIRIISVGLGVERIRTSMVANEHKAKKQRKCMKFLIFLRSFKRIDRVLTTIMKIPIFREIYSGDRTKYFCGVEGHRQLLITRCSSRMEGKRESTVKPLSAEGKTEKNTGS